MMGAIDMNAGTERPLPATNMAAAAAFICKDNLASLPD